MGVGTGRGIARFRAVVCRAARHPGFVHHRWYVEYHLVLVERIALELCGVYPDANRGLVQLLVWLHDYGKIVDRPNEHAATLTHGRAALVACGFGPELVARALHYYKLFERYDEVARAPLEVRIASSADGAAHLVGPFYAIWWHEHPERDIPTLMADIGILIAGITLSALLFVAFGVLLAVALIAAAAYVGVALARRSSES